MIKTYCLTATLAVIMVAGAACKTAAHTGSATKDFSDLQGPAGSKRAPFVISSCDPTGCAPGVGLDFIYCVATNGPVTFHSGQNVGNADCGKEDIKQQICQTGANPQDFSGACFASTTANTADTVIAANNGNIDNASGAAAIPLAFYLAANSTLESAQMASPPNWKFSPTLSRFRGSHQLFSRDGSYGLSTTRAGARGFYAIQPEALTWYSVSDVAWGHNNYWLVNISGIHHARESVYGPQSASVDFTSNEWFAQHPPDDHFKMTDANTFTLSGVPIDPSDEEATSAILKDLVKIATNDNLQEQFQAAGPNADIQARLAAFLDEVREAQSQFPAKAPSCICDQH